MNQIIDNGGQPVDLGYNITGYKQGAAGSSYLSWQEGNWSLVVRASNINGESPDDLAKNVVNILEQETLPTEYRWSNHTERGEPLTIIATQ